ncbi:MAG: type II toxin-antitoxin system VapC family toxin [Actinomycetota bacterium]|nr:type II toxin-antitoxin system VapC family toxin [Actinomycetota bacterium]
MTPVVIDASAGVELVADTTRGRALRRLLPADSAPWAPETFYLEVGTVLRRWDLNTILTAEQVNQALRQLADWPLRVAQVRSLFADAWKHRHNITFADATYGALAEHLGAQLLTDDHRLANTPTLPVSVLRLSTGS